jgi:hypothetical protein
MKNCEIGIHTNWDPSNLKIFNSDIGKGSQIGLNLLSNTNPVVLDNCTLNATDNNFDLTSSFVYLFNTTFNESKVYIDFASSLAIFWHLHVQVRNWLNNPVSNANVQIRAAMGTLVFYGFTDANGFVKWIWLHERTQFIKSNETSTPYFVQVFEGEHSGSTSIMLNYSTNITVYLENDPPDVSNVVITPTYPTTISDLALSYEYDDTELDPEGNTLIMWYTNGIHNSSFDGQMGISSQFTQKSQTWFCEVIPHDSTVYGSSIVSMPVTIQNTPPIVVNVTILEMSPTSADDLSVTYDFFDIDGDTETRSLHRWHVYDQDLDKFVYKGQDTMVLNSVYTKKGEYWKCIVTPGDGDDYGSPIHSQVVFINNTAPKVLNAIVLPDTPKSNQTLSVDYTYFDLDNDPETDSIIKWYRNNEEQTEINGSLEINPSLTSRGDVWCYVIVPFDGVNYGDSVKSNNVTIENTAPIIMNISIYPEYPSTSDDLAIVYEYYDADGDTESRETIIEWLKWSGVEFTHTGLKVHTLSSSYTTKNEIWTCEITPHDNYSYGKTVRATVTVTISNSVPTVSEFYITPDNPKTNDDLTVNYKFFDLDNELENGSEIHWYRDDEQILELNNKLTVSKNYTHKGQVWHFRIYPSDGFDFGDPVESERITIHNSAPSATNLTITPRFPLGDDNLVASYIYSDLDGDNESTPEIRWYKDGEHVGIYDNKFEVEAEATVKGDNWYFTITVFDGLDSSEEFRSYTIRIENSKPIVNSISPTVKNVTINETESKEFYVEVFDPDGDFLNIIWRVNKEFQTSDVFYPFETDYQSSGIYDVNLTIQDLGENSFTLNYDWKVTVRDNNRLPTILVNEPIVKNPRVKEDSTIKFEITATDQDLDNDLRITWYLDDVIIPDSSGKTLNFRATHANIGKREIKVVVSDSFSTVDYAWNLTVEEETVELGPLGIEWDVWGILIEIIVLLSTGILAFIGYRRLRKKKGALKVYMDKIEEISKLKDKDPEKYESELNALEETINSEFKKGKLEDLHYLMLQELLATNRGEVRRATVSKKFRSLPKGIAQNLDEMLKDGKISREEYIAFVTTMQKSRSLTPYEKKELSRMVSQWEVEDTGISSDDTLAQKIKAKDKIEMNKWEQDEDLDEE